MLTNLRNGADNLKEQLHPREYIKEPSIQYMYNYNFTRMIYIIVSCTHCLPIACSFLATKPHIGRPIRIDGVGSSLYSNNNNPCPTETIALH